MVVGQTTFRVLAQAVAEAKAKGGNAEEIARNVTGKKKMEVSEALQILDVNEGATPMEIEERYEKMFAANDPARGGSFYLQSKIYRAKEALDSVNAPRDDSDT